ncbi:MAG TPA: phospho-sugar mutase [Kofleriaceae bacterium]|nr:phospho-sugar mutase [Kofleriaceae bacterium]
MSLHSPFLDAARRWAELDPDRETAAELVALYEAAEGGGEAATRAAAELSDRFGGRLEFGTAGIRGVLAAGPMRMNQLLVRQVSAGLATYVAANVKDAKARGIVIGHDARRKSRAFAEETAAVFLAAGFRVMLAHEHWPTPVTAWAVRAKNAAAGVMVTASHNPPEYNGYKVYWENGAQIIPPHDTGIAACIDDVDTRGVKLGDLAAAAAGGLLVPLGQDVEDAYLAEVLKLQRATDVPRTLRIAYTPLHGVGAVLVERALAAGGFAHVATEPSQRAPDGAFPTVAFPNPEEKGAMDAVLALARAERADLVLANDPDADRLAVALPDASAPTGYRMLTGDQVGVLLADYLLAQTAQGRPRLVACSLVSSQMLRYVAEAYGAQSRETLTGFKWIANVAMDWMEETGGTFVLGYEEALGYSVGDLVADKDGVSAALLFAELAAWNRARGRTVADHLDDLYRRVGLFLTEQVSITAPGAEGLASIKRAMTAFRAAPPATLGGHAVDEVADLARGEGGLPPSDVLIYRLAGGRRVIMRPSGTEPKLKSYYEVRVVVGDGEPMADARARGLVEMATLRDAHQTLLRAAIA